MSRELLKDLIYGEQLVTDGCKVELAVGLTYSLNLETMLMVPLAIGDLGDLDSSVRQNPAYLLEGIRKASDKIILFCNKGCIHVPKESKTIFSLLEKSIFEVQNGNDIYSNFHPKLWLIKEQDKEGKEWMKLITMSRNLDFSSCLDICCTLRGKIGSRKSKKGMSKHQPLKEMLIWVSRYADKNQSKRVCELAEQLDYVDKFELDAPFQSEDNERQEDEGYSFFPFIYNCEEFKHFTSPLEKLIPGERILVVSPFIDKGTLEWLTCRAKDFNYQSANKTLITRKEYVTQSVFNLFDDVWVPNDTMLDNTTANINLHAKMYLTQRLTGDDLGYSLYLGSANATKNAFHNNSEFLLRLHYRRTTSDRIKEMIDEMTNDHQFIKLDAPNPEATDERPYNAAEIELKKALVCMRKAVIKPSDRNGYYDIMLTMNGKWDSDIKIRPLQCPDYWEKTDNKVFFKELLPHLLSEFYVISIPQPDKDKPLEMIAKVKTSGMPSDRDETIYQTIVTMKEELLDYVAFMISDHPTELFFEQQEIQNHYKMAAGSGLQPITMPLYEQLLKTASKSPKQITEVLQFVRKMKPDIVPMELVQMLEMFQNVSKQIEKL